jgi:acetylornithine/N-succinyldiaminopimelate aminotransferase
MSVPGPIHPLLARGEYPFTALEARSRELCPPGIEPIHFSVGDPREETPDFIRQALREGVPEVSSYPSVAGEPALRRACAGWLERRFGIALDSDRQVLPVNGTKEAVFSLALAVIARDSPRRTVVIPTPAYPVYAAGARFAGAEVYETPLSSESGWRFDPSRVPETVWEKTALLWLNVPHNPTGALLDDAAYDQTLALARRFGFWVAADEAYSEVYFERRPRSALEFGADNVLALHTLSKRSAMTGYRSGFMAGDARLLEALRRFRPNLGVATPEFVQRAAIAAWNDDAHAARQRERYAAKRELLRPYFARRGWAVEASEATFYLWMKVPAGDDVAFVDRLMRVGVVPLPGRLLGEAGTGYVRWALVPTLERCREALARLDTVPDAVTR